MGCGSSRPETHTSGSRNPIVLASQTHFSVSEVEALYELYRDVSNSIDDDDLLSKEEFQLALFRDRNKQNFFAERVFDVFNVHQTSTLDFAEFVKGLSVFHPNATENEKIEFTFKVFDLNRTEQIGRDEVKQMLVSILSESDVVLPDDRLNVVLDQTFDEADHNHDGFIDKDDWRRYALRNPAVISMMTLPCLKDVTTTFPSFIFQSTVDDSSL